MSSYQTDTYRSPFFIKRWMHQKRFTEILKILNLKNTDTLLDYGCGDGYLIEMCFKLISPEKLYGYDPAENMYRQAVKKLNDKGIFLTMDIDELRNKKFTKITCLETCEHLSEKDLEELFKNIKEMLESRGKVIISVPIETGIPALVKNSFRFFKNRHYDNLNFKSYIRTFLGLKVPRNVNQRMENVNYIYSHIGFDHRSFERLLSCHFKIESRYFSPVNIFGSALNNSIFYTCIKK